MTVKVKPRKVSIEMDEHLARWFMVMLATMGAQDHTRESYRAGQSFPQMAGLVLPKYDKLRLALGGEDLMDDRIVYTEPDHEKWLNWCDDFCKLSLADKYRTLFGEEPGCWGDDGPSKVKVDAGSSKVKTPMISERSANVPF